ncbi:MAG: response regulator [Opitutales bacterium]
MSKLKNREATARPTVVIVEDERLMRQFLVEMCQRDYQVVAAVSNGSEALKICRELQPNFAIIDIEIPEPDGIAICDQIKAEKLPVKTLLLSSELDPVTIHRVYQSEADGFVDKIEQPIEEVLKAVETIRLRKPYFSRPAKAIRDELRSNPEAYYKILSPKELELMPLFCEGLSDEMIAHRMSFTKHAAHWHRKKITAKLNLHGTIELMRYGRKIGFWK